MGNRTVEVREYEREQLVEYLPDVIETYEESDIDTDHVERMLDEFEDCDDGRAPQSYEFDEEDWSELTTGLRMLDDMRATWLASKLARRSDLTPIQMAFTSTMPVGALKTGQAPVRPE